MDGIVIKAGAEPMIQGNKICHNRGNGLYVFDGGRGVVHDNDIFDNGSSGLVARHTHTRTHARARTHTHTHTHTSGVVVRSLGDPQLTRNRIHHGKKNGVYIYLNGRGTLEGNDIFDNKMDGISVKSGGNPTVTGNVVRDGKGKGIFVHDKGRGNFEGNDVIGNGSVGVSVATVCVCVCVSLCVCARVFVCVCARACTHTK